MNEVNRPRKPLLIFYIAVLLILFLWNSMIVPMVAEQEIKEVDYGTFMTMTEKNQIGKVQIGSNKILFTNKDGSKTYKTGIMNDPDLVNRLHASGAEFTSEIVEEMSPAASFFLNWILPIIIFVVLGQYLSRRMMDKAGGGPGSMMFNLGKSNAKVYVKSSDGIKFSDVEGVDEAEENLQEIVDYLHNPEKYREIGASMPNGVLLVGPPGTGKTLLAKAVAGEANVPFFSMSGSDFVEMFVGVGASRVRDLFRQAKEKAPAIVFIDEIDAVGRARGKNNMMGGGNDERESTLNQLLTEMDGFGSNSGVIILAATNRADVLDAALLRAGRFDRQIHVELPDLQERKEIFGVHIASIKIDKDLDINFLAKQTPGFSGADIANVCNEAALIAARNDHKSVSKQDFMDAVDRIIGGLERKNKIMTEEEKRSVAYHEAGHATISWLLRYGNPLVKVTIVPRGMALGAAWYLPEERQLTKKDHILDNLCSLLYACKTISGFVILSSKTSMSFGSGI